MSEDRRDNNLITLLIEKVDSLNIKLDTHMSVEEEEKKKQTEAIAELKAAFDTAVAAVKVIRWLAAIVAALALSWAFIKEHLTIGVK